jgi:prenyltransferase beta subunit
MLHFKRMALSATIASVAIIGLLLALGSAVSAQPHPTTALTTAQLDSDDPIGDALAYLETQQLPSGAFPGWTGEADEFTTIKVVLALAADRQPVSHLTSVSGTTAVDYLETEAYTYTRDVTGTLMPGRIGMLVTAIVAADEDPYAFGVYPSGHASDGLAIDLVDELESTYDPVTGAFSTTASAAGTINQAWSIIGLAAAQETVPVTATNYLISLQEVDGGWGYGFGGDADTTAHVIQALLASGNAAPTHADVQEGLDFLRTQQNEQSQWGYWWGPTYIPSADTTASVIQALVAAGYTPATESWAVASGETPQTALAAFQAPDGSFSGNALGTAHAIAGMAEASLPILSAGGTAQRALSWLAGQQNADGGFGSPASGASATADVVIAFGSAGIDARTVQSGGGNSAIDFLLTQVPTYNADGGEMGKLVLAAVASGEDPRNFGGYDLVFSLTQHISPTGEFGTQITFRNALGILALAAAEETVPPTTTQWLKDQQLPDGGWGWGSGLPAETDASAMAIQALIAADEPLTATSIVSALNFLHTAQSDDAGFTYSPAWGNDSNANSTAYALQALVAAGEDLSDWTRNRRTPLGALRAFQKSDGPFVYQWGGFFGPVDNLIATYQAVPALLARPHPILPQVPDDGMNHAGVVVDYGDGTYETACASFNQPSITGHELMTLTGIPYTQTGGFLDGIREVTATGTFYWSYWYRDPVTHTWQSYFVGFDDSTITDGDVDGWHYVDWTIWPSPPPGINLSLGAICGLETFESVFQGPDPDRMVAATMRATWGNSVDVVIPFGSDLNEDGSVGLEWREVGEVGWTAVDSGGLHRSDGYYTATLPFTPVTDYEFRATFEDPDQVQFGTEMSGTVQMAPVVLESHVIHLPFVVRND